MSKLASSTHPVHPARHLFERALAAHSDAIKLFESNALASEALRESPPGRLVEAVVGHRASAAGQGLIDEAFYDLLYMSDATTPEEFEEFLQAQFEKLNELDQKAAPAPSPRRVGGITMPSVLDDYAFGLVAMLVYAMGFYNTRVMARLEFEDLATSFVEFFADLDKGDKEAFLRAVTEAEDGHPHAASIIRLLGIREELEDEVGEGIAEYPPDYDEI